MSGNDDNIPVPKQFVSKVGDSGASRSKGQIQPIVGTSEEVCIVINDTKHSLLNTNLQEKVKSLKVLVAEDEQATNRATPRARIQEVPFTMRHNKNFLKYYEPTMVAIGPIHHHVQKLQWAEKLKHRLAGHFIKENFLCHEELCIKIKNELEDLKNCYEEEVISSRNNDDLTWMFLVDGCAMLKFIHSVTGQEVKKKIKELKMKNDQVAFVQRDMFLLENQLPYRLLNLLISSIGDENKRTDLKNSIQEFIVDMSMSPTPSESKGTQKNPAKEEPLHLLELLRHELTFAPESSPTRITNLLRYIKGCCRQSKKKLSHSFRSVSELKSAGILLKPSRSSSFNDISFKGYFMGTLRLPPIMVDDSTPTKLLNLIAFEMCPDFVNEFEVTSFICFLDSLIDNPEDVKQLRKAHILNNNLGSDEEVATLFNRIGTDLVPNPDTYLNVKNKIEMHYKSRVTTWVAQGLHDHFASPWTILAFLATILALALTFIQTWYAVHPAKDDQPC